MKRIVTCVLVVAALALMLTGCGGSKAKELADGTYTVEVTLEGGSGKSSVESPTQLTVQDGVMTATLVWSSSNYDYMVVDGETYQPTTLEPGSTFEIPVAALDEALTMIADTTAMGTPHEVEYTLTFDSASVQEAQ